MEREKKKKFYYYFFYYWLIVLVFMAILFYYSTTTLKIRYYYKNQDKTIHFLAYSGLGFIMVRAFYQTLFYRRSTWISLLLSIFISTAFGIFIEICQIYCNRSFEVADIIANALGTIAGSFFYIVSYQKIYPRIRNKIPIFWKIEKHFNQIAQI